MPVVFITFWGTGAVALFSYLEDSAWRKGNFTERAVWDSLKTIATILVIVSLLHV